VFSDADEANAFDVERYLACYRRPKPPVKAAEVFDYYEIDG
jgi:hypothetical protein